MKKIVKLPTIKRLPRYLYTLRNLNTTYVSTSTLISELQLEPVLVRKDLSILGLEGKPRVGYVRLDLIEAIEEFLGWNNLDEAFIIGVGALGTALLKYNGFQENGLKILAGFDIDPQIINKDIDNKKIFHISKLKDLVNRMKVTIAILCVPSEQAQDTTNLLIAAGIKGIWNFTNVKLNTPKDIIVQNENLSSGWAVFSVKLKQI